MDASAPGLAEKPARSTSIAYRDVLAQLWVREQLGHRLLDAIVITTGPTAYRRPDGVAVVPLGLLAP